MDVFLSRSLDIVVVSVIYNDAMTIQGVAKVNAHYLENENFRTRLLNGKVGLDELLSYRGVAQRDARAILEGAEWGSSEKLNRHMRAYVKKQYAPSKEQAREIWSRERIESDSRRLR